MTLNEVYSMNTATIDQSEEELLGRIYGYQSVIRDVESKIETCRKQLDAIRTAEAAECLRQAQLCEGCEE